MSFCAFFLSLSIHSIVSFQFLIYLLMPTTERSGEKEKQTCVAHYCRVRFEKQLICMSKIEKPYANEVKRKVKKRRNAKAKERKKMFWRIAKQSMRRMHECRLYLFGAHIIQSQSLAIHMKCAHKNGPRNGFFIQIER